jgi:hypothetical protein
MQGNRVTVDGGDGLRYSVEGWGAEFTVDRVRRFLRGLVDSGSVSHADAVRSERVFSDVVCVPDEGGK